MLFFPRYGGHAVLCLGEAIVGVLFVSMVTSLLSCDILMLERVNKKFLWYLADKIRIPNSSENRTLLLRRPVADMCFFYEPLRREVPLEAEKKVFFATVLYGNEDSSF